MATLLRAPPFRALPPPPISTKPPKPKPSRISFAFRTTHSSFSCRFSDPMPLRLPRFLSFASSGETDTETHPEAETTLQEEEVDAQEPDVPDYTDATDGAVGTKDGVTEDEAYNAKELLRSPILESLLSYKEAVKNGDESKFAEVEAFLKSIEDEKINLKLKVATLSEEISAERERVLRISADFDNFRKRTERERLSLVTNAQGELVEKLLPVLDNFERAKTQIKVGTEAEEKINNSYQSIYKQFMEMLSSLGVVPVEPKGNPFDPLLHEAIMREESTEFEEGIVLEEYRKGFKLGDTLLRPSMVKVSAGPGPGKVEQLVEEPSEETGSASVTTEESSTEAESA